MKMIRMLITVQNPRKETQQSGEQAANKNQFQLVFFFRVSCLLFSRRPLLAIKEEGKEIVYSSSVYNSRKKHFETFLLSGFRELTLNTGGRLAATIFRAILIEEIQAAQIK
jgi:hypothetical protein